MPALDAAAFLRHAPTAAILDCRDAPSFAGGHLAGAGHLPLSEFRARRSELPPRDTHVAVVAASALDARSAAHELAALGYPHVSFLDAPAAALGDALSDRASARALWRPSPWLARRLPSIPPGRALDVAAGFGRESVHLAMHGFRVDALDHAPEALARARALATHHGVSITTETLDLERKNATLPAARYDLVCVFRFLHRPLLPAIETAIGPGGHLLYETFMRGQERFGRPSHPRFLFWPGELRGAFPTLEVLAYEESDPPEGPVMARLHARRSG